MSDFSRNIEIKAQVHDMPDLMKRAEELSQSKAVLIEQKDVFFKVPHGRMKLRFKDKNSDVGELIFYDRSDTMGPKLSKYDKSEFVKGRELESILSSALGTRGIVRKKRFLFLKDQTRIHVDQVENLGNFMELEVVLKENQTPEEGMKTAEDLMNLLGVSTGDLQSKAYIDLLEEKSSAE